MSYNPNSAKLINIPLNGIADNSNRIMVWDVDANVIQIINTLDNSVYAEIGGSNSFKFIKQINYDGIVESITIPYSEITSCNAVPEGCYPTGTTYNQYLDYQVQIWLRVPDEDPFPAFWQLIDNGDVRSRAVTFYINETNGDLSIGFRNFQNPEIFRVVVLA